MKCSVKVLTLQRLHDSVQSKAGQDLNFRFDLALVTLVEHLDSKIDEVTEMQVNVVLCEYTLVKVGISLEPTLLFQAVPFHCLPCTAHRERTHPRHRDVPGKCTVACRRQSVLGSLPPGGLFCCRVLVSYTSPAAVHWEH